MLDVAVLVKLRIGPEDVPRLKEYRTKNVKAQKTTPGFESLTVWESQADPKSFLLMIVYADDAAADEGLKTSMEVGALVGSLKRVEAAPEVRRGRVGFRHGKQASSIPVGAFASVSFRVADPGRGRDLSAELSCIFGELGMIDGYLGSFVSTTEALAEEAVGVVFWSNRKAFETSLPNKMLYEVELYRRMI